MSDNLILLREVNPRFNDKEIPFPFLFHTLFYHFPEFSGKPNVKWRERERSKLERSRSFQPLGWAHFLLVSPIRPWTSFFPLLGLVLLPLLWEASLGTWSWRFVQTVFQSHEQRREALHFVELPIWEIWKRNYKPWWEFILLILKQFFMVVKVVTLKINKKIIYV